MAMGGLKPQGGAGTRGRRGRQSAVMAEINVTPMVDVMLVLLIIFMVAAPLLTAGVPIELPKSQAKALTTDGKPITVTVTPTGELFIGEDPVAEAGLVAAVTALAAGNAEQHLYLRGDATAQYGIIMRIMGLLSAAGFSHIGLITEQQRAN